MTTRGQYNIGQSAHKLVYKSSAVHYLVYLNLNNALYISAALQGVSGTCT